VVLLELVLAVMIAIVVSWLSGFVLRWWRRPRR
jgi:hypothetical protein